MSPTVLISILTFVLLTASILFFPSIRIGKFKIGTYWIAGLIGAVLLILFQQVPLSRILSELTRDSAVNPIKILVLFFSMTFISVVLDEAGLFRYLAKSAVRFSGKSQVKLFVILYFLVAVLTVFTSNDIMILSLTPFICFFCKNTDVDPVPYLVAEFTAANTWSMMLIIGNPTNVYLATSAGIAFMDYFRVMILPTLAAGIVEFGIVLFLFIKKLKKPFTPHEDDFVIQRKADLLIGVLHLACCLVFLVISGYLHLEMWLISAVFAVSLLVFLIVIRLIFRWDRSSLVTPFKRLPWQLVPFVLSMFVIVICLNYQGISGLLGETLGESAPVWTYGGSSFLAANLINNIPMSILFSTLPSALSGTKSIEAIYASVIGSNIGAFLTPIGALAGIMFTELAERHQIKYGFRQFICYDAVIAIPTLFAALLTLSILI